MPIDHATPDRLDRWCQRWLGASPALTLFEARHLSSVIGLRLTDGREVVVKARPASRRIGACVEVQRRLWQAGFPCPEPLVGPVPLGSLMATEEELVPDGEQLGPSPEAPRLFAEGLAALMRVAPPVGDVPSLAPPPTWVWWDHDQAGIWPWPDDGDADLNAACGPAWLDIVGRRVRRRLQQHKGVVVVGHADWESQNMRWLGQRLHVVHDWDSVASLPEATIVGAAAAVIPASGAPAEAASLEQTDAFLTAYGAARGRPWSGDERQVSWAAGLWVRAFNARKEAVDLQDGPVQQRLIPEARAPPAPYGRVTAHA